MPTCSCCRQPRRGTGRAGKPETIQAVQSIDNKKANHVQSIHHTDRNPFTLETLTMLPWLFFKCGMANWIKWKTARQLTFIIRSYSAIGVFSTVPREMMPALLTWWATRLTDSKAFQTVRITNKTLPKCPTGRSVKWPKSTNVHGRHRSTHRPRPETRALLAEDLARRTDIVDAIRSKRRDCVPWWPICNLDWPIGRQHLFQYRKLRLAPETRHKIYIPTWSETRADGLTSDKSNFVQETSWHSDSTDRKRLEEEEAKKRKTNLASLEEEKQTRVCRAFRCPRLADKRQIIEQTCW